MTLFRSKIVSFILAFFIILTLSSPNFVQGQSFYFEYTRLHGEIESISEYNNKPIVILWTASWCDFCQVTQENMNEIYSDYSNDINFFTISYGGSGDSYSDVSRMKGSIPWIFGLDHTNAAERFEVTNGFLWILNTDITLEREWNDDIVSSEELSDYLDEIVTLGSIDWTYEGDRGMDEFEVFQLQDFFTSPFFIGFILFVILLVVVERYGPVEFGSVEPSESKEIHLDRQKEKNSKLVDFDSRRRNW